MTSSRHFLIAALLATAGAGATAQTATGTTPSTATPAAPPAAASASAPAGTTDGEVRKVDKPAGKLTLRHGRIESLDMPAMTMVFRVAEPSMLDGLKEGDKVRFAADRVNGALTVTRVEPAR